MKKDKEWLKGRIKGFQEGENMFTAEFNAGVQQALEYVQELIDQLDESELTQDQVDKYLYERNFVAVDQMMIHQTGTQNKVVVEKPVIPKFVADWIDAHNLHGNNPLREYRDLENDFNEGWTNEKDAAVYHWVNKNPYAFIDALRYGYEVEKEPRWVVKRKNGDYVDYFGESVMHMKIETFIDLTSDLDSSAPHKFTDKAKAEAVALLVDGVVEEVGK